MTRNLKISLLAVFVVILLGVAFFSSSKIEAETQKKAAADTIGFVDVQAVFEAHPDKAAAEAQLNEEVKSMQAKMEEEVKDQSQDEREATMQKYQDQLSQREQELISQVISKIDDIVREVADEQGVKVVLDKKNVIYGGVDLTQQVIERVQQQSAKK